MSAAKKVIFVFLLFTSSGCVRGILYQNTTLPFSTDMRRSRVGSFQGDASSYRIKEPISGANISVEWNSFGFGDAFRKGELAEASVVDLRSENLILGIWSKKTLVVSGEKAAGDDEVDLIEIPVN